MSELTPRQHLAVRHAAATLLMKEPEMQHITRKRSDMTSLLERGEEQAQGGGPTKGESFLFDQREGVELTEAYASLIALFGVPLSTLVLHESTDSHHGIAPDTTLRIPTFIDHCLTALMQMGTSLVSFLFSLSFILLPLPSLVKVAAPLSALHRTPLRPSALR